MKEKPKQQPTFEEAIARLEAIVETMENGDTPLAELLAKYEQAAALLKICEQQLENAELKVEQLNKTHSEHPAAE